MILSELFYEPKAILVSLPVNITTVYVTSHNDSTTVQNVECKLNMRSIICLLRVCFCITKGNEQSLSGSAGQG